MLFAFVFFVIAGQMNRRALARDQRRRKTKRIQQLYVHSLYTEMEGHFIFCHILSRYYRFLKYSTLLMFHHTLVVISSTSRYSIAYTNIMSLCPYGVYLCVYDITSHLESH